MKTFFKIILAIILSIAILYAIVLALTYYQYNFSPDFADRKPIENNL